MVVVASIVQVFNAVGGDIQIDLPQIVVVGSQSSGKSSGKGKVVPLFLELTLSKHTQCWKILWDETFCLVGRAL